MIGNPFRGSGIFVVEVDNNEKCRYNKVQKNDSYSIECENLMAKMSMYTDLPTPVESMYNSDYEPFEAKGYIVIGADDGSAEEKQNPHYHTATDTPDLINWNSLTSVAKMVLATILS
jgi:hypothetical protein